MSNQQDSLSSQDLYLRDGDWIQFQYQNYALYSDGFKSGEVCLKSKCHDPLSFLFTITHPQQYGKNSKKIINFNEPIILIHRLSNKYLSYNPNLINKSQFRLRTNLSNQCHFILKPLYKCQTLRGNLVRNKQECTLNPAISQYVENISLVAGKMQKQAQGKLSVFLKKNQFTGLKIIRKNICKKTHNQISNYQIYQLNHIEEKVPLCYQKSQNNQTLGFKKVQNNYTSFLMIQHQQFNLEQQKIFRNKEYVSIKILATNSFIGFTQNGSIFLTKQKSSETRFKLQMYSKDNDLIIDSLLQFEHVKTGKYLSFDRGAAAIAEYQTNNVFELKQINSQQLKDNLFINITYCSLRQELLENSQIKRRRSIQSILRELSKFIYKNKQVLAEFSKLKQLKICISQSLQNLFATIGFIPILKQICEQTFHQVQDKAISKTLQQIKNMNSSKIANENIQQENLYLECCLVLVGICKGNKKNIWEFSKYFQMFFEHVGKIKGSIKVLFYLVANSSDGINIFENIEFPVKKQSIKALQFFCESIYKNQMNIENRIEIIKFLHGCLLDENQQKSYVHELILMSALAQNKLKNIFFSLSHDSDHFLIVDTKIQKEQLSQMVNRQEKYQKQLQLLLEQIDLLITISSRASKRHVYFFRDIISEEMVNKYLKIDLNPQFKSIFLKILVNVYLNKNNHVSPQSFIIVTNPKKKIFDQAAIFRKLSTLSTLSHKLLDQSVEMQEVNEDKFKFISNVSSLNSIKDYILRTVKAKLQSNRVEDELIYCLYAFSNFLELGACEEKEGEDVLNLVTRYLEKQYELYKIFNIELVTKYLGLLQHNLTQKIKIKANELFSRIRTNYKENQVRSKYSKKIIEIFNIFSSKQFNEIMDSKLFSLLTLIISHSLETKSFAIFQRTSQFLHKINNIAYYFLESIKESILIESDNSNQQLKRINKLFNALSDYIIDYIYIDKSKQSDSATLRKYICQILSESIQLLQNHEQDEPINTISQKIMGSFNFFQIVTQLICQKQLDLQKNDSDEMFQLIFKFIKLYLLNSDDNFLKKAHHLQKLRVLFKYRDKGQVKLLWNLTCIKLVSIRLNKFLLESWISSTKQASQYIYYIPLGLLKVIGESNGPSQQQQNIDEIVKHIIQGGILRQMVKIESSNLENALIIHHCNANSVEQWLFYMTLLLKLLLKLVQKTTVPKQKLLESYRQLFPMKTLIKLIDETFILQFDQVEQQINTIFIILIKMIKKQLIELFIILYLQIDHKENQYLIYLAQRLANRLVLANSENYSDDYLYKNLVYFNKHNQPADKIQLRQTLIDYLKAETSSHFQLSPQAFHTYVNNIFLFVNSYYNFLFKICEKLTQSRYDTSDSSNYLLTDTISIREMVMFLDNLFKKYKEFINEKITYSQYSGYYIYYNYSIKLTQEITNKKVGLNYNYQPSDEQTLTLLQGQEYFQNPEVDFVLKSYLQSKSKLQKYLYQSVLVMIHNQNIQIYPQKNLLVSNDIKSIVDALIEQMKVNFSDFKEKCKLLCNFILTNNSQPQWEPHLQYAAIISKIVFPSINMNHSDLKYYVYTQITLLRNYFSFNDNVFKRYKIPSSENAEQLIAELTPLKNKISEIIQKQISFYDRQMIMNQSALYFQCKKLNYHLFPKHLSIQLVLQWLLLKVQYSIQNVDKYYNLIIDIIHLVKAYSRFLFQYDKRYLSGELFQKISLSLKILFRSISGNNIRILMAMIEQQIWNDLNLFMSLNDSLQHNLDSLQLKTYDMIKSLSRIKLNSLSSAYAQAILQLYNNSMTIYGQNGQIIDPSHYPLVPIKSYFHQLKYLTILIMKQFKNLPLNISAQFFSKIDGKYLQSNICNHFEKYNYFNSAYTIAAAYPQLKYKGRETEQIAASSSLTNGVELTALKMYIDSINGNKQLQKKYSYHCYEGNQSLVLRSFLKTLNRFVIDFVLIFLSCIWTAFRKNKRQNDYKSAIDFFITKIGRVQLAFEDKIYEHDFMVYPQCSIPTPLRKSLLQRLNFISIQLKRQSILLQTQRIILHYQNQLGFFKRFHKARFVLYIDTYTQVFKVLSYLLVITNNILLIANEIDVDDYRPKFRRTFQILTLVNFFISLVILILYCIKNMPLVAKTNSYDLNQGIGYFGKTYQEKSKFKKKLILAILIIADQRFIQNLVYTVFVALIFLNPVFASVLLLDILAHIPTLRTLLLSIWRPRYQLILTMVTYVILQYFFSIFLYFLFRDHAAPNCDYLGQCFTFIFTTTFKSVNGFVGYLFQKNSVVDNQFSAFEIFEDFYVIVIYQIIMALILAIVIESFTVSRAEKLKQIDYIKAACIICNIERSKFNTKSKFQFKGHISISHNLYSYINFKYGLTFKKFEYMNDFQISALTNKSSAWIPDGKTKQLFMQQVSMKKDEHTK